MEQKEKEFGARILARRPSLPSSLSITASDPSAETARKFVQQIYNIPCRKGRGEGKVRSRIAGSHGRSISTPRPSLRELRGRRGQRLVPPKRNMEIRIDISHIQCSNSSLKSFVSIDCHPWNTVADIKDALLTNVSGTASSIRLFKFGKALLDYLPIFDYDLMDGDVLYASENHRVYDSSLLSHGVVLPLPEFMEPCFLRLVKECNDGFRNGYVPQLSNSGSGGTYLLKNGFNLTVAVYKPEDEEPFAPNNPRNHRGTMHQVGLRKGILSGEAAKREVAAYLVDHQGFAGVPLTTRVEACHRSFCYKNEGHSVQGNTGLKIGSLQEFVTFDEIAGDVAPQLFPVLEVHKIGILDIRLLNMDRNDGNILLRFKSSSERNYELIPVDHGYCIPEVLEIGWCDWCWITWPQCHSPFDEKTLSYISHIDVEYDISMLRSKLRIREEALRLLRLSSFVLKKCASAGLTLYEIATVISRNDLTQPSLLEILVDQAHALLDSSRKNLKRFPCLKRSSSHFDLTSRHCDLLNNVQRSTPVISKENMLNKLHEKPNLKTTPTSNSQHHRLHQQSSGYEFLDQDSQFWSFFDVLLDHLIESTHKLRSCSYRSGSRSAPGVRTRRFSC